jgi:hypothetical protein
VPVYDFHALQGPGDVVGGWVHRADCGCDEGVNPIPSHTIHALLEASVFKECLHPVENGAPCVVDSDRLEPGKHGVGDPDEPVPLFHGFSLGWRLCSSPRCTRWVVGGLALLLLEPGSLDQNVPGQFLSVSLISSILRHAFGVVWQRLLNRLPLGSHIDRCIRVHVVV